MSFVAPAQRVWVLSLLAFAGAGTAVAADLAIETFLAPDGSAATLQVRLITRSDQSAAIQFDLEHHPSLNFSGSSGPVVLNSGKTLFSRSLAEGRTRFLIAGLNTTLIADGLVLSLAAAGAAPGTYQVALRNTVASDPQGGETPLSGAEASLNFGAAVPESPSAMLPYVAAGGGWKTTLSLLNSSPAAASVRVASWNSGGSPLVLPWAIPMKEPADVPGSSVEFTIQPNAILEVVADDPASQTGANGWIQLFAPAGVTGWVTYAVGLPSGQQVESVVPIGARAASSFVLPFDNSADYATQVAITNGSATGGAVVLVVARDREGRHLFSDLLQLPVRGQATFIVPQKYVALAGEKGTLEFQNTREGVIAVIGLKVHPSGSLAAIFPAEKN